MSLFIPSTKTPMNEMISTNTNNGSFADSITDNNINGSTNKVSTFGMSSTSNSNSSSTLNMPSPPLSPYTRNDVETDNIPNLLFPRATKPLTSDLRLLELYTAKPVSSTLSNATISFKPESVDPYNSSITATSDVDTAAEATEEEIKPQTDDSINGYKPVHTIVSDLTSNDSVLHINAYEHFNKPGYKRNQLKFLSQYQFKNFNSNSISTKYASLSSSTNSNKASTRHIYDSPKPTQTENSDSDIEKPRTRRLVRQNRYDLESVENSDSILSRPTTPISVKKRVSGISSPSTPKRQRTSTPVTYNYDYKKIEDFCPPPYETLPNNNKCLKTDWKGQSMDLSTDPLIGEMHPAEIVLASILRLPCGVYLDSKRRIFQEKVKRMKYNLPFRRTDAQKSCKIDVNKASRLFASFEKVGWFDEKHFQKFM